MRRRALVLLLFLFVAPGWAQAPAKDDEVQPRFIWGILIQVALSKLASASWDVFSNWLSSQVPSISGRAAADPGVDSGAEIRGRSSAALAERGPGSTPGNPAAPLSVDGGRENYQGVHIALAVAGADGKELAFRPISAGFKTGERFKLRVVATFAGELALENINPKNERRHLYPPKADQVVALKAGRETFLPLGKDEWFQFTRATGREQLVLHLADPRAVGAAGATQQVHRQDVKYGTNFLQQVGPNTYPRISQSIELQHSAH